MDLALQDTETGPAWPGAIYACLKQYRVKQISYVPDAGHSRLITLAHADPGMITTVLTTEEEGIALSAGAWLGGQRSALLMQSSGVGNCVNMLSLMSACRFPLLTLVTMRGEWMEFNQWQVPMGRAAPAVLRQMGVTVMRVTYAEDASSTVGAAAALAYEGDQQVAVLISQKLIGKKQWVGK